MANRPPPRDQLDPRARTLWRLGGLMTFAVCGVIFVTGAVALVWLDAIEWWWAVLAALVLAIPSLAGIYYVPDLTWRRWRYEVGTDEVDLQYGVFTVTRTLIPMARIQHVDTRRGPLQQRFGLASVVFFTAAGSMEIPALSQEHAADVRNRIADLAKVHDDL